ncbi:hypothetical protein C4F50_22390 [Flavobacterium sp. KB82]|uniref:Uncharacterized protein n=1 Tax=Flavobacterium hungaricum TaxID=2082725 RepID=A0ABR9TQR3_9FLAO|nr:hypothetical protein [Flavobacterium hungaricum]
MKQMYVKVFKLSKIIESLFKKGSIFTNKINMDIVFFRLKISCNKFYLFHNQIFSLYNIL